MAIRRVTVNCACCSATIHGHHPRCASSLAWITRRATNARTALILSKFLTRDATLEVFFFFKKKKKIVSKKEYDVNGSFIERTKTRSDGHKSNDSACADNSSAQPDGRAFY